ncbi:MAG: hypothetical protein D6788_04395 [Planctomycetota bacterium]|nr:MAG: hypothetical protein D6788_04395 [Planctomycetota bacterium]
MTDVATPYLLYLVFALGGAGVYLMMPRAGRSTAGAGAVVCVLAAVALLIVLGVRWMAGENERAWFFLFSLIALAGAVKVVTHTRPVYSALYFVLVVLAVAALAVLQAAEFLAIALVIIYAGAILVTYLFVIMLAQQQDAPVYDRRAREPFLAVLSGFVLMAAVAGKAGQLPEPAQRSVLTEHAVAAVDPAAQASVRSLPADRGEADAGNTLAVGTLVMTEHVAALEMAAMLLLVSMVGAIAMSRKKVPAEGFSVPEKPIGRIGREVEPF